MSNKLDIETSLTTSSEYQSAEDLLNQKEQEKITISEKAEEINNRRLRNQNAINSSPKIFILVTFVIIMSYLLLLGNKNYFMLYYYVLMTTTGFSHLSLILYMVWTYGINFRRKTTKLNSNF